MLKPVSEMTPDEIHREIVLRERRLQMLGLVPCTDPKVLTDEKDPHTRVFLRARQQQTAPATPPPNAGLPANVSTSKVPKPVRQVRVPDVDSLQSPASQTRKPPVKMVSKSTRFLRIRRP